MRIRNSVALVRGAGSRLVRQATPGNLPGIVNIHRKAFSRFFLTKLGGDFLRSYYELVLHYRAGIMLVSEGPEALEGLVCGSVDTARILSLTWRSRGTFVRPVLSALLRHPSLAAKVLDGVHRIQTREVGMAGAVM